MHFARRDYLNAKQAFMGNREGFEEDESGSVTQLGGGHSMSRCQLPSNLT